MLLKETELNVTTKIYDESFGIVGTSSLEWPPNLHTMVCKVDSHGTRQFIVILLTVVVIIMSELKLHTKSCFKNANHTVNIQVVYRQHLHHYSSNNLHKWVPNFH